MLTPGQACDLDGADVLLPALDADIVLADKAYDADERVIHLMRDAGKKAVVPSKKNRLQPRDYDRDLYKARPLIFPRKSGRVARRQFSPFAVE